MNEPTVGIELGRDDGANVVGAGVGSGVGVTETLGDAVGWSKTSPAATQKWSA